MAKVKVRVLYPSAFVGGVAGGDEVEVDEATAKGLVAEGFAEVVASPPVAAEPKRGPGRPRTTE